MQHLFFILSGVGLGIIAGIMAYLVTYEETSIILRAESIYRKHKRGFITFLFFVILTVILGYVL